MGFQKVTTSVNNRFLVEGDLTGIRVDKVCYVLNYSSGTSKLKEGFYRLTVKTYDGVILSVMIFNPLDFINQGLDIAYLKNRFIMIGGFPQIYNGRYSIIAENINVVSQESVSNEDRMKFLGAITDVDELYNNMYEVFSKYNLILPETYKYSTYSDIYAGKIGGYVKFISNWFCQVCIYIDEYSDELLKLFYYAITYYNKLLVRQSELDVITPRDKFNILKSIPVNMRDMSPVLEDILLSLFDLGKPEHLLSHILYSTFKSTKDLMLLQESWKGMPVGGVLESKDLILRKY